jgi:anti-sigma factor RsiW
MTCQEAIDFVLSYLDGELTPAVRAEFDRHLAICESCAAYLDSYQKTVRMEQAAFSAANDAAVAALPEELVKAILSARAAAQ